MEAREGHSSSMRPPRTGWRRSTGETPARSPEWNDSGRARVLIVAESMTDRAPETVEAALEALSVAVAKASDDLRLAHATLDRVRADVASRNTSVPRSVVSDATRVVDHLRGADDALRDVVKALESRG
jgi:hypothetical protein